ncbi:NEDD8-conjugating protein UBC12 Ecym_8371 [Eremothecium cymbalariae DBVPG|uniref:NEDD8-conjugating enzyme UBC12 n=1 Tax=Eremothecium cymbalariae (strain CBS 270.75 / DBVPG 7215 / KCTC 17166 / NRRL Y-17582) TaxID=931890 RepID=G8JXR8_ERECY|nr:Hypothetical protein Ecym_8371 [Eremothecium cymbalariae DBVPG\
MIRKTNNCAQNKAPPHHISSFPCQNKHSDKKQWYAPTPTNHSLHPPPAFYSPPILTNLSSLRQKKAKTSSNPKKKQLEASRSPNPPHNNSGGAAAATTAAPDADHTTHAIAAAAKIRIDKDLTHLELPPTVSIETNSITSEATLYLRISPDEGFYKHGHFGFSVSFKDSYPIDPPIVKCLTTIYHPNIDYNGNICLNVLREDWTPVLDLQTIVIGLLFLFLEPNPKDPLNKHAAHTMVKDPFRFERNVLASMKGATIDNHNFDCLHT